MREGNDSEEAVHARLSSVLSATTDAAGATGFPAGTAWATLPGASSGGAPLSWVDVVPGWADAVPGWPHDAAGWPDDVTLPAPRTPEPGPEPAADSPEPPDLARRPPWSASDTPLRPAESTAGSSGPRISFGAFDPGRRGVKALAAVAIVVVLVAALIAWRSRPRVDAVPPPVPSLGEPAAAPGPASSSAAARVVVAVGGKVRRPGLVQLAPGARVADVLQAAGGALPGVDVAPLNLARKVVDGELIMVGATLPPGAAPTAPAAPGNPAVAGGVVNLNTATLADLDTLPGVGPVLAQRILDARDAQGGFKAVTDLRQVDGIGSARFEQLKDLVTV